MKHAIDFSTFGDKENNSLFASRCMKDLPYVLRKKSNQKRCKFRKFNSKLYSLIISTFTKIFFAGLEVKNINI